MINLYMEQFKRNIAGLWRDAALCLVLALGVAAVYHSVLDASFISFDDSVYVYENPVISKGFSVDGFWRILNFKQEGGPYWHPVTSLSHMADCTFFGLDPRYHHLSNVVFHILNTLLLFFFLQITTNQPMKSFMVALIFAVHPLNVETVAWVSERKNLVATFFFLLGLHVWRRFTLKKNPLAYAALFFVFLGGIMSKPLMLTFPFTLLLVHHFPMKAYDLSGRNLKEFWERNKPVFAAVAPLIVFMLVLFLAGMYLSGTSRSIAPLHHVPLDLRLSNMVVTYFVYLKALILPVNLSVFHPYPESLAPVLVWTAFFATVSVSVFALYTVRSHPFLFCGWFWYLGNLFTASGLMQKGYWPAYADRFTYLPMIGIFVVLVWGFSFLCDRHAVEKKVRWMIAVCLVLILALVSSAQVRRWENAESLFSHAVTVNPLDVLSLTNLALALGEQGRFNEAIKVSERALAIEPRYAEALNNMGTLYAKKGEIRKSLVYFEKAVSAYPGFEKAVANAQAAQDLLKKQESLDNLENKGRTVLENQGLTLESASFLARIYMEEERYERAEALFRSMLEKHPGATVSITYNLACVSALQGNDDQAVVWLEKSMKSGFKAWNHLDKDPDLSRLREREDYKDLIRTYGHGGAL